MISDEAFKYELYTDDGDDSHPVDGDRRAHVEMCPIICCFFFLLFFFLTEQFFSVLKHF